MSQGRTVVLVHGIGGPRPVAEWITPLNAGLGAMGYPTLNADVETFVNVDYRHQLMAGDS